MRELLAFVGILFIGLMFVSCATTPPKKIIAGSLYSPDAYVKQGLVHYQNREFEQAVVYFEKAVELNRYHQPAHSYLGASFAHLGRKDEAIDEFYKVIEIDANSKAAGNAKKWLERLTRPPILGVLTVKGVRNQGSNLERIATNEFIRILANTRMYKVMNLSDVDYSQIPSSCEIEALMELSERRGAQILILPRTIKLAASALAPVDIRRKGGKTRIGVDTERSGSHGLFASCNLTMSIAVYNCRKRELITSIFEESSGTFLFSSYDSAARSLFQSCSEKIIKELMKQVL